MTLQHSTVMLLVYFCVQIHTADSLVGWGGGKKGGKNHIKRHSKNGGWGRGGGGEMVEKKHTSGVGAFCYGFCFIRVFVLKTR